MEEIKEIVKTIVRGCAQGGIQISDVLAAFVARTIVEKNTDSFALDKRLSSDAIDEVVVSSIEKLLETDSPPMETIKMQVEFDASFLEEDNESHKIIRTRNKMIASHKMTIIDVVMEDANDFETLMMLYRKIFRFLLEFTPSLSAKSALQDKSSEREVAAALESVFPRIGLKSFVQLSPEEKNIQLMELARIVLGIRLFNQNQGRGGEGIDSLYEDSDKITAALEKIIHTDVESFTELCNKYQYAIVTALRYNRKLQIDSDADKEKSEKNYKENSIQSSASKAIRDNKKPISEYIIERWSQELANRRQYLGFIRSLQDDIVLCHQKISQLRENLRVELANLKGLVGAKASVPKEQVYPKFDSLANIWLSLWEEFLTVRARSKTFEKLSNYKNSFRITLTDAAIQAIPGAVAGLSIPGLTSASDGAVSSPKSRIIVPRDSLVPSPVAEAKSSGKTAESRRWVVGPTTWTEAVEMLQGDPEQTSAITLPSEMKGMDDNMDDSIGDPAEGSHTQLLGEEMDGNDRDPVSEEPPVDSKDGPESKSASPQKKRQSISVSTTTGAILLSVNNTPDFMLLPLELQGFCPWTMATCRGLLVPGKPAHGVIRYENLYYVCDTQTAVQEFLKQPDVYLKAIRELALANPEFIHLLRLQHQFPTASIAKLLERQDFDQRPGAKPLTRDVSTETPIHFLERHIDVNYHWNEWELRRRALKVANLKNCSTVAQQTDFSDFRRDSNTQVYLPRDKETQTKREKGTNPPIKTTYIAGLRGKAESKNDGNSAVSRYVRTEGKSEKGQGRVVTLTLDF